MAFVFILIKQTKLDLLNYQITPKKGVNWVIIPVVSIHKSQFISVPVGNKGSVDGKVRL